MRLIGVEVGFFEDRDDEEVLVVGIAGVDGGGVARSFVVQRSTYEPEEQDIRSGMDSYCVSTELGHTAYGCLCGVRVTDSLLTLEFTDKGAEILEIPTVVDASLGGSGIDRATLSRKLREVVDWGASERRPEFVGPCV
ncbi:Imm10 family immunity protein [Streptomyces sp. NBC_00370]|uniref:Imm10 family immunity protein n=1 Tax=Streptomyces sp. NBC_00370 TaxID=2975728 RepID=UPI002E258F80